MRIDLVHKGAVLGTLAAVALTFAPALAKAEAPAQLTISSVSTPTNFNPTAKAGEDFYHVLVTNTGDTPTSGPITVTDELPLGLTLDKKGASGENTFAGRIGITEPPSANFSCQLSTCTYNAAVIPDQTIELSFPVDISSEAQALSPLINTVRVTGGGALAASQSEPTTISSSPAGFGIPSGAATTAFSSLQAGAHPDITNDYGFTTVNAGGSLAADPKEIIYRLPPGFASDFADTPSCSQALFLLQECPPNTQVGFTTVDTLKSAIAGDHHHYVEPVYNIEAAPGQLATLGFTVVATFSIEGQVSLRPGDYGANVTFHNIDNVLEAITGGSLTVWGVPADPVHNALRWQPQGGFNNKGSGSFGASSTVTPVPYFTNPTSCTDLLHSEFQVDSWEEPDNYATAQMSYGPLGGCDSLTIQPQAEVQPSANSAETATGLNVNFKIPQHYDNAYGDVASNLDDVKVVLPEGMTLNPSAGAGLQACSEAQFAYEGEVTEPEAGRGCPREAKLGTLRVRSPGVPKEEEAAGSLYLARPFENKFDTLVAVYLVARIPDRGVVVTAAGKVEPNPITGRLTTVFDENPQLPFSELTFTFHQGATSPLVTPPTCGAFASEADLTPWSVPGQEHLLSSVFEVTSGIGGGPCPSGGTPPFKPQVVSGTENYNAGAYSPFYLRIVREDGEQELTKFSTTLPRGLTGNLTGIPFCPEADIEAARAAGGTQELEHPSCPQASEIGHTIVEAGVGGTLAQTPGKLYLGGPYHGAPLSVVSVTAAKVGPFDLGTVVIRFALDINPITAQVEISGASSDPIPHIIDGIVVHLRDIRAYVDREKFILNPTSCDPFSIAETITGAGANPAIAADQISVGASAPFQVADCASLGFKPTFKATTSAKNSRTDGASLHVAITYPKAPQGTQANIKAVKVDLPRQLPSRLTTLQKACTSKQFEANPSGCPAASRVGSAKALTPILPVPLEGPAYFVSYGDLKFPELIIVLQGYGFTIYLHGETFISKAGITSSTFRTVPDQPVTSFELTLPQGPYSALANNGNLCTVKGGLKMPTALTAQNGAVIKGSTPISVSGCPKAKKAHKAVKHHKKRAHGKKK